MSCSDETSDIDLFPPDDRSITSILDLPDEILCEIFNHLLYKDRWNLQKVCHRFKECHFKAVRAPPALLDLPDKNLKMIIEELTILDRMKTRVNKKLVEIEKGAGTSQSFKREQWSTLHLENNDSGGVDVTIRKISGAGWSGEIIQDGPQFKEMMDRISITVMLEGLGVDVQWEDESLPIILTYSNFRSFLEKNRRLRNVFIKPPIGMPTADVLFDMRKRYMEFKLFRVEDEAAEEYAKVVMGVDTSFFKSADVENLDGKDEETNLRDAMEGLTTTIEPMEDPEPDIDYLHNQVFVHLKNPSERTLVYEEFYFRCTTITRAKGHYTIIAEEEIYGKDYENDFQSVPYQAPH